MLKDKSFLRNPIIIFSIITLLLGISIYFLNNHSFCVPDYYTNRTAALEAAQIPNTEMAIKEISQYENPKYGIFNALFQIFGWLAAFTIFSILFKVTKFKDFKHINIFRKKRFIYPWINLSYLLYCYCWVPAFMNDLEKYVYNSAHDTMAIPLMNTIFTLGLLAVIYYTVNNLLFFVILNTKIKSRFYTFILLLALVITLIKALAASTLEFTYWQIGLDFFALAWIVLLLTGIKLLKEKRLHSKQSESFE